MRCRKVGMDSQHGGYFFCDDVTLPADKPRRYGVVPISTLPRNLYDQLLRNEAVEVPYEGKLYTDEELYTGAWVRDVS